MTLIMPVSSGFAPSVFFHGPSPGSSFRAPHPTAWRKALQTAHATAARIHSGSTLTRELGGPESDPKARMELFMKSRGLYSVSNQEVAH